MTKNSTVYKNCNWNITGFKRESESQEYEACRFTLNGFDIISRSAKITPKKVGQFVTFWQRNDLGVTVPFMDTDSFDYYVIDVCKDNRKGQFVFPKSVLIDKGVVSTIKKEGKRGFRVYPIWDTANNKQAIKTQAWQINYFFEITENMDINLVKGLYPTNNSFDRIR